MTARIEKAYPPELAFQTALLSNPKNSSAFGTGVSNPFAAFGSARLLGRAVCYLVCLREDRLLSLFSVAFEMGQPPWGYQKRRGNPESVEEARLYLPKPAKRSG